MLLHTSLSSLSADSLRVSIGSPNYWFVVVGSGLAYNTHCVSSLETLFQVCKLRERFSVEGILVPINKNVPLRCPKGRSLS